MNIPKNIDFFNRFSIVIFLELYKNFPTSCNLDFDDLIESMDLDEAEAFDKRFIDSVGFDVITFLSSEGFVMHDSFAIDFKSCFRVRLTMKGLAILGSIPDSLKDNEESESIISMIQTVIGNGLKDATSDQVQKLVSKVFTLTLFS